MGIGERRLAGRGLGLVLAPDLAEAKKVTLRLGIAIDLVGDGLALGGEGVEQSHPGDAQAAIIGGVFAQGQFAVELLRGNVVVGWGGLKTVVFGHFAVGAFGEGLAVFGGLPLAQVSLAVVLEP